LLVSTRNKVAILGGPPIFSTPLNIVRPRFPQDEIIFDRFKAALRSGQVTNNSPWVVEFESQLAQYLDVPTLTFCNGQAALLAMMKAADIEGKEVIVPSFTFSATPHAVRWCGGIPVFADIKNDGSLTIDPEDVERKISSKTAAIMGVCPYGIAAEYEALHDIGKRHGIKVYFDSAPAFGTKVDGKLVGGFGHAQIFSFHATKAFSTMEGGCVCSNDKAFMERVKNIRNFGLMANGDCEEPGFNGKMPEIAALIGIEQLKTFHEAAAVRRQAVARIRKGLENIPGLTVAQAPANQEPIWLYLPVIVDAAQYGLNRDQVAAVFEKENLFVRKYYSPPCHHLTTYKQAGEVLPHTETAAYNVVALPVYNDMTEDECDGIVQAFVDAHRSSAQIAELRI
jgi:dTDP-4-amino-4,6-dideoxyglucose